MKSLIGSFNQQKMIDLGMSCRDFILVDYLCAFFSSGKAYKKRDRDVNYYWITYKKIMEDLPILKLKKRQLTNVLNDLQQIGVLIKYPFSSKYLYITLNLPLICEYYLT